MLQQIAENPISIIGYSGMIVAIFLLILNYINHSRRSRIIDAASDYHSLLIRKGRYPSERLRMDYMYDYNDTLFVSWISPRFIMKSQLDWDKIKPFYYGRIR